MTQKAIKLQQIGTPGCVYANRKNAEKPICISFTGAPSKVYDGTNVRKMISYSKASVERIYVICAKSICDDTDHSILRLSEKEQQAETLQPFYINV